MSGLKDIKDGIEKLLGINQPLEPIEAPPNYHVPGTPEYDALTRVGPEFRILHLNLVGSFHNEFETFMRMLAAEVDFPVCWCNWDGRVSIKYVPPDAEEQATLAKGYQSGRAHDAMERAWTKLRPVLHAIQAREDARQKAKRAEEDHRRDQKREADLALLGVRP